MLAVERRQSIASSSGNGASSIRTLIPVLPVRAVTIVDREASDAVGTNVPDPPQVFVGAERSGLSSLRSRAGARRDASSLLLVEAVDDEQGGSRRDSDEGARRGRDRLVELGGEWGNEQDGDGSVEGAPSS